MLSGSIVKDDHLAKILFIPTHKLRDGRRDKRGKMEWHDHIHKLSLSFLLASQT
jgi:hypothetical protein